MWGILQCYACQPEYHINVGFLENLFVWKESREGISWLATCNLSLALSTSSLGSGHLELAPLCTLWSATSFRSRSIQLGQGCKKRGRKPVRQERIPRAAIIALIRTSPIACSCSHWHHWGILLRLSGETGSGSLLGRADQDWGQNACTCDCAVIWIVFVFLRCPCKDGGEIRLKEKILRSPWQEKQNGESHGVSKCSYYPFIPLIPLGLWHSH